KNIGFSGAEECQSRDYGNGGTVCVCNANHCDTISKPEKVERPHYVVYTSNKAGLRFTKKEETFLEKSKTYQKQIVINSTRTFQQIFGWGSTFTDATGININSLGTKQQENLLKSYFSEDGLEYNLCRVPMGASDYSTHAYTYDDGEADEELTNFRLAPEDFQFKIPHIKSAQNFSNGNLQLFASAWIAPIWMEVLKAGKRFKVLKTEMYQPWANYFVKFLDNYRKEGIEFWGITTGNEPTANAKVTSVKEVNSVAWNPFTMMPWILGSLGPTIRNSDYSNINIMVLEDQRYFSTGFIKLLLKNNSTRHYVDGIAMHWYYNKVLLFADLFAEIARKFPEKFVLATESSEAVDNEIKKRGSVDLGSWDNGEAYTNDLIKVLK
ncbi:Glyco hydro 30 domain containing protein, partial [Asbolus verrucosus]